MRNLPFAFGRLSPAVRWLMVVNALVFLVQMFFSGALEATLGLIPREVLFSFQFWRAGTYLFLHGSFWHLAFNLFTLWMFGKELELAWGTREFLKFYFICGLGAAFCNVVFEPFSGVPVIGASGALYGVLVAFAVVFPDSVIYLYGIFPLRARQFVALVAVFEFFASFQGAASTVARLAHLGGLATGFLYLRSYELQSRAARFWRSFGDSFRRRAPPQPPRSRREDLAKEVDRILEKVLVHGAGSLTDEERELMRRYASKKRD